MDITKDQLLEAIDEIGHIVRRAPSPGEATITIDVLTESYQDSDHPAIVGIRPSGFRRISMSILVKDSD